LQRFGLPTHLLPQLVEPGTRLGALQAEVVQRTGLAQIPVIAPATHDTGSAVVGVPAQKSSRPDWAYISSGTWSLVGIETAAPWINPLALELNMTNEGGVDGTWRVLKNVMGLWLVQQCRKSFAANGGGSDYAALMTLAAAAEPLRSLVNPDAPELLNPPDMPAALREQCRRGNQPIPETEGALVRCALESLALKYAVVLDQLERLSGVRIEVIHIVGGGARNTLLNQMTADACQRRVVAGPAEATVLGNLLMQARAMGELGSLAEIREVVRQSSELLEYLPEPSSAAKWSAAAARIAALKG
jgi:rhamnulokinase